MKKNRIMDYFSALGRSLMMPIAALAAFGIILGLTGALLKPQVLETITALQNPFIFYIITLFNQLSGVEFTLIPVLFAISIAFGLAKTDKEIAAFAGFIGYYAFLVSSSIVVSSNLISLETLRVTSILGVETIDMGAVAGMITGMVVAALHNKYHDISFPVAIAFYGGKRFVAIIVLIVMGLIGQVAPFIWAPVSGGINALGTLITNTGTIGVFFYGFLERLLIPTGLHHVLNVIFRTTAVGGVYEGVEGVLNIFLQYFDSVDHSVLRPYTRFLGQGKMPFMIFGLPAAAYAIYKTTPADKQARVKALMIAGVAASMVSGITEPLEFSFLFIAPALFIFHSIMGGISFALMSLLGVTIGNTGGGLIDFFIWGVFQPGSNWHWVIIIGLLFIPVYYFVFKYYFQTKGITIDIAPEEDAIENTQTNKSEKQEDPKLLLGFKIIEGLGGYDNITGVNNCISRLRVDVKDMSLVKENILKSTGSLGIVKPSDTHLHVIYGPKVEEIANSVHKALNFN